MHVSKRIVLQELFHHIAMCVYGFLRTSEQSTQVPMFLYGTRVVSTIVARSIVHGVFQKLRCLEGGPQSADFYKRLGLEIGY